MTARMTDPPEKVEVVTSVQRRRREDGGSWRVSGGSALQAIRNRGALSVGAAEPALSGPFSLGPAAVRDASPMRRSLLLSPLLLLPALAARADDRRDHERARAALAAGEIRPPAELLAEVERRYAGLVIEAELEREDGRWVYEIRILPSSGRVFELRRDGATGALLRSRGPVQERP